MATNRNYGIAFCKRVILNLENIEDDMFEKHNHGFDMYSKEYRTLIEYRRLLTKFKHEKASGLSPTYDSSIHGD